MPTIRGVTTGPDLLEHIVEDEDDACTNCGALPVVQACPRCNAPLCAACDSAGAGFCGDCLDVMITLR